MPKVTVSLFDTFSAAWVGVGGQTNGDFTLIQLGLEHNSIKGQEQYNLWYELLPEYAIKIQNNTVYPGDKISASVTLLDENAATWLMMLKDVTNGKGFSQNFVYNS